MKSDVKKLIFSTKADTLKQLEGGLTAGRVLPQYCFTVEEYNGKSEDILDELQQNIDIWCCSSVIVRSSALSEDSVTQSNAGKYLSIAHVRGEVSLLDAAIKKVITSYDSDIHNQVLVQPMLDNIQMSGVFFTIDPQNNSPYFVINYDDTTGSTDSVTSGAGEQLKTCYLYHGAHTEDELMSSCRTVSEELMGLFDCPSIDVEFAISNNILYVLQVRPLIVKNPYKNLQELETEKDAQKVVLQEIQDYISNAMKRKPYLYGDTTVFGVMPDWNPAEIIGLKPKPLAISLYKYLVTDGVWAYQRDNYGYKNLRSFPLMIDFSGLPYIDTRVSFNSFIPKSISHPLSEKLANYYLDKLKEDPNQQDKVEFSIILSCFTFDIQGKLDVLEENGFSVEECQQIKSALLDVTNRISHTEEGLWKKDMEKIQSLESRLKEISTSDLSVQEKIYWILEDCSRYGTLPFAGLARVGFVAVLLLKSMVQVGLLSDDDYRRFMGSLSTVSSQMAQDYEDLEQNDFLLKYGHLRPGTYDISSPRYDKAPEVYFSKKSVKKDKTDDELKKTTEKHDVFKLSLSQYQKIQDFMKEQGLEQDVLSLFQFIKVGIEQREYSKFVFSKSLSFSLELIGELGEEHGFTREDMAFLDIQRIKDIYSKSTTLKEEIADSIEKGKFRYKNALKITLPPVITCPEDVFSFHMTASTPNYITQKTVTSEILSDDPNSSNVEGKIILLHSADPGYDWIFAQPIDGFVTAYGGVNSHMAIRANEMGVPAVIGVGEQKYQQLKGSCMLKIDCANKKMEILS